jgi:MYXO-CTERM domain-containing protein
VTDATDDDCLGDMSCDAEGECKAALGSPCVDDAECVSGFCVDQRCCTDECDAPCQACGDGICTTNDCGAYSCFEDARCRERCEDSTHCAPGHRCEAAGDCVPIELTTETVDGCGCRLSAVDHAKSRWPAALLLTLALLTLRRRRMRALTTAGSPADSV